jgi:hypothetical protein
MDLLYQAYFDMVAKRARDAGYKSFQDGYERRAPAHVNEYASAWVEGWNQAALDALEAGNLIAMAA